MPDKLEIRRFSHDPEMIEVPEGERLYIVVPANWMTDALTPDLQARVKEDLIRDSLNGRLDAAKHRALRELFSDSRLVEVRPYSDIRPRWGLVKDEND